MNFHGLNRAALDGGVVRAIAGAALIATMASLSVNGLCTQYGGASVATASVVSAAALRTVLPSANVPGISGGYAQWVIATGASATATVTSALTATNTDAYSVAVSPAAAAGFIGRPGGGAAIGVSAASATPSVTLGYTSTITIGSSAAADAGVQRNGQSTVQRDGFAMPAAGQSGATALPLKTAMGFAQPGGTSSATTDSIKTHGGMSAIAIVMSATAMGSIDFAQANASSNMTAIPTLTQYAGASITPTFGMAFAPLNTTQGAAAPIGVTVAVTAAPRTAALASAQVNVAAALASTPRLALMGSAESDSAGALLGYSTVTQFGQAQTWGASSFTGAWIVLRFGAASFAQQFLLTADPITNPAVHAPAERVAVVPADDRLMVVQGEDRTMRVL